MFIAALIHNSQRVETAQTSINGWMDEQIVVYTYKEYYSAIKRSTDRCYNVIDARKQAKWKKPRHKGLLYDSIYLKYPE